MMFRKYVKKQDVLDILRITPNTTMGELKDFIGCKSVSFGPNATFIIEVDKDKKLTVTADSVLTKDGNGVLDCITEELLGSDYLPVYSQEGVMSVQCINSNKAVESDSCSNQSNVNAIQWRGDNFEEVISFLSKYGFNLGCRCFNRTLYGLFGDFVVPVGYWIVIEDLVRKTVLHVREKLET